MTTEQIESAREQIHAFGARYDYDTAYMESMLAASPEGFARFQPVAEMAGFQCELAPEVTAVARVATFVTVDCGPCLELNLKLAREAGVADDVLRGALRCGVGLRSDLVEVRNFAAQVAAGESPDPALMAALKHRYGEAGMVEIALAIAGSMMFPAVKRAMGFARSCAVTKFSV